MDVISIVMLLAVVQVLVKFAKYLTNRDWNGTITVLTVVLSGCLVAWLASTASVAADLPILGSTFGTLDGGSVVLAGFALAASAAKLYDYQSARDSSDSAAEPPLLAGKQPTP